jgi:hypothetical protein
MFVGTLGTNKGPPLRVTGGVAGCELEAISCLTMHFDGSTKRVKFLGLGEGTASTLFSFSGNAASRFLISPRQEFSLWTPTRTLTSLFRPHETLHSVASTW